ncbi:lipoprotein [Spiroplasma culicicola]|uniref:Chitinase n=1 Tax=Spiroplasma culicicola AES-1 TaxID=1276246 RepID=W6A780_9MOLU|nr:lipoprotein [Spiroplasma culicicola]AHI52836.1 hypothetical protein SCULI_v1c04950 [Spiroplasma culicicola AES-1]
MKKLLSLIGAASVTAPAAASAVSCGEVAVLGKGPLSELTTDMVLKIKEKSIKGINDAIDASKKLASFQVDIEGDPALSSSDKGTVTLTPNIEWGFDLEGSAKVQWMYVQNLHDVIKVKNLGEFEKVDASVILSVLSTKNTNLDTNEIEVINITNKGATIQAKNNSEKYYGSAKVSFSVKEADTRVELSSVIKTTSLGELADNQSTTILNAIANLNSALNTKEVTISNITSTSALINSKSNSKVYKGSVAVKFTVEESVEPPIELIKLEQHLKTTNLGEISKADENTILSAVKAKNSQVNTSEIEVSAINDTNATIKVKANSTVYEQGSIKITYSLASTPTPPEEKIDLKEHLKTTDLLGVGDSEPDTLLAKAETLNPDLIISELEVINIGENKADIKVKNDSEFYNPSTISVTFTISSALEDVISVRKLGEINDKDSETILNRVAIKNQALQKAEVEVINITDSSATIKAKDNSIIYKGSVEVTFSIFVEQEVDKDEKDITKLIQRTMLADDLITLPTNPGSVWGLVIKANANTLNELKLEHVIISDINENGAIIKGDELKWPNYKGTVEVSWSKNKDAEDGENDLGNLGEELNSNANFNIRWKEVVESRTKAWEKNELGEQDKYESLEHFIWMDVNGGVMSTVQSVFRTTMLKILGLYDIPEVVLDPNFIKYQVDWDTNLWETVVENEIELKDQEFEIDCFGLEGSWLKGKTAIKIVLNS